MAKKNEEKKLTKKETNIKDKKLKVKETKKEKKVKTPKKTYGEEIKAELKKVKWPTKQEMLKYSIAVIVFIVIFGLYFYGLDAFFAWITSLVKGL
ncbi:MAG: preprotein translocase subunit SecE [bacterium]|nr:preprotein translocase subunit SecE [bacterium]